MKQVKLLTEAGFTLLEMLIVMVIMVFISFAIYQTTTQTFKLRDALSTEGDFYNAIRLSMGIMQRDISLLYSPIIMVPGATASPSPTPQAQTAASVQQSQQLVQILGDDAQVTDFWEGALDKTGLKYSRFVGTDKKISFISSSHLRIYKEAPESEFAKITYELKRDEDKDAIPDTSVLVKTEDTNAFDIKDSTGLGSQEKNFKKSYGLVHGIKSLTFKYYQKPKDGSEGWKTWTSWDTDKEDFKNSYPDVIEVTIDVKGPSGAGFQGLFKFRPEIPYRGLDPSS